MSILNTMFPEEVSSCSASPRIIIIGAGVSGIAAASKLFENGFQNVTILEAENRIGGRVYTTAIGEYLVDMGGQWVHGEKNNSVYESVWPLGLLQHHNESGLNTKCKLFGSSGEEIPLGIVNDLLGYLNNFSHDSLENFNHLVTGSFGEYAEYKLKKYLQAHLEIRPDQHKPIIDFLNMALDMAVDWHSISAIRFRNFEICEGDQDINWKNQTYGMILDILMKRYPNPNEELPIIINTRLNNKVIKIIYKTTDGLIKLLTEGGNEYSADHVIFTGSLGVLQADYDKLFHPPLPDTKIKAIKSLGIGGIAKIYLYYENPWWIDNIYLKGIFWTESDRKEIENDSKRRWMLSIFGIIPIEHKPKVLCIWLTGSYVRDMELLSDDVLRNQILELFNRFFGRVYNVNKPSIIIRTLWNTNENFRGTYSYPSLKSEKANVYPKNLGEPITINDKPIIQFAGEATARYFGTVNGAIDSGRQEADRLINFYSSIKH